jgi:hypothetical protein
LQLRPHASWAGLRPGCFDGLPPVPFSTARYADFTGRLERGTLTF